MSSACSNVKHKPRPTPRENSGDAWRNAPCYSRPKRTSCRNLYAQSARGAGSMPHAPVIPTSNATKTSVKERRKLLPPLPLPFSQERRCLRAGEQDAPVLILGDFEHAEALVLLQQLVFGPHLLPQVLQLLLLLLRTHSDAGHGADQLPHLLELVLELIQHLVNVLAVLVHAAEERNQRQCSSLL